MRKKATGVSMAEIRAALIETNARQETEYWILMGEADAIDVASGFVPNTVKAFVLNALDASQHLQRAANRPTPKQKEEQG